MSEAEDGRRKGRGARARGVESGSETAPYARGARLLAASWARMVSSALTMGQADATKPVLVRVHAANAANDVFRARVNGETSDVLGTCLRTIAAEGVGALLYMQPANRDQKLLNKAAATSENGEPVAGMDLRGNGMVRSCCEPWD